MTKTFGELLEEGFEYPEYIDEVTAEMISDWFRCRYVTTNNFYLFFNRSLALNYPYYRELLRVDPVISKFDWFVEEYLEKETTDKIQNTGENVSSVEGSSNTSKTLEDDTTKARTGSQVVEFNGSEAHTKTGSDTDTISGTVTTSQSKEYKGTEADTKSGTDRRSISGTDTSDTTGTNENVKSGSMNNTLYGSETHNVTRDNVSQNNTRVNAFNRNNPMSAEYQTSGSPVSGSIMNIAGSVSLNDDNINRPCIVNPTYSEDSLSQNTQGGSERNTDTLSFNNRSNREEYNNITDSGEISENVSRETNTSDNITYGETNTRSFTNRKDDTTGTEGTQRTETKGYNNVDTRSFNNRNDETTYNVSDRTTGEKTETSEKTDTNTKTDTINTSVDRLFREIHTGRHENVAKIIDKARNTIISSESWLWFYHQLDKCFLQVFDV